jgi:signal transduction histidine kinase
VAAAIARTRSVLVASLLLLVGLALPLGAYWIVGRGQAVRDAELARATEVATRLEALRATEARRPWYHYQRLYHEPRAIDNGASLLPSPLGVEPRDELVRAWFAIDAAGEPSAPTNADAHLLASIRAMKSELVRAAGGGPSEAQVLAQGAYFQNVNPAAIYADLSKGDVNVNALARGEVVVHVGALRWAVVLLDGVPELVGLRAVRTPDGSLTQGFVVRREALGGARIVQGVGHGVSVPLLVSGGAVEIEPRPMSLGAFHSQFFVIAAIAFGFGACVIVVVARSERLARDRAEFAAVAAHELRTPLAGLRLHAEMLAEDLGDPAASKTYARRIADEAERLSRVVTNVLGFTRLERGMLDVHPREGDLAALVRREIVRLEPSLAALGVAVEPAIEDVPRSAFDADAVVQILHNLVDNAEKYARTAKDRTIRIALRAPENAIELVVEDRGPGVEASLGARLFRPFARGSGADAPAGVGLGLSIGRALARAQGGDLAYADRAGGGSVFTLTLPR